MNKRLRIRFLPVLSFLFLGCNAKSGPEQISLDRDVCKTCHMTISQPAFAAEVRAAAGQRLHRFDDFGCAIKYAGENNLLADPAVEIWVADSAAGGSEIKWIDARRAYFLSGEHTPMDYGLRAQSSPADGALNFEQAKEAVSKPRAGSMHHHMETAQ